MAYQSELYWALAYKLRLHLYHTSLHKLNLLTLKKAGYFSYQSNRPGSSLIYRRFVVLRSRYLADDCLEIRLPSEVEWSCKQHE